MKRDPTLTPQEQKGIIDLLFTTEGGRQLLAHWEYMHVRGLPFVNGGMSQRDVDIMFGKAAFVIDLKNVLDYGVDNTEEDNDGRTDDPTDDSYTDPI